MTLSIPGVMADQSPISGTNIQLTVATGAKENVGWQGGMVWTDAQFYHGKLTIGGEDIYDKTYPVTPGGGGGGGMFAFGEFGIPPIGGNEYPQNATPPGVRFASNHFSTVDPSSGVSSPIDVPIVLVADFALIVNGVWDGTSKITVTATITPRSVNRMAMWKSAFMGNGQSWSDQQASYINDLMQIKAKAAIRAARYGYDPNSGDLGDHPDTVALADIAASTSAFVNAHGESGGIGDSWGTGSSDGSHWLTWQEIETALNNKPCQWVFVYACSTGVSASGILAAFNVPQVDGAYAGFSDALSAYAYRVGDQDRTRLSFGKHGEYLLAKLAEGYAIADAVDKTYNDSNGYRCFRPNLVDDVPMVWAGDEFTTWTSVYLYDDQTPYGRNALDDAQGRYTAWFVVFD